MNISDVLCVSGRSGYFHKDLAASRAGARANGLVFDGPPLTPGFEQIVEPGEIISVMLVLDDGQVAVGDCVDVIFAGAAGRDRVFLPGEHMELMRTQVRDRLTGRAVDTFAPFAAEVDDWEFDGARLHTALRYGITQALLDATALSASQTIAEVVAREYGCTVAEAPVPLLAMCPTEQRLLLDKMILKRAEILPHASFSSATRDLGTGGTSLLDYAGFVARRIGEIGAPGYRPVVHLDLYGTLGELFDMNSARIADFMGRLEAAVAPFPLYVETPVIAASLEAQIAAFCELRQALSARGCAVKLIADEWANTLDDIRRFADAGAADFVQVKTPDLGGVHNAIEALLHCRRAGIGAYLGGSANETEHSSRICAHVALACHADVLICKPGQGVDEALMILGNEMRRALARIQASASRRGLDAAQP